MSEMKKLMEAYQSMKVSDVEQVNEDVELEEKKLDPVDDKELKGKHKDRKDKDIDNDGDVDSSDEYLHKRRKAIKKSNDQEEKDTVEEKKKRACESVSHSKWGFGEVIEENDEGLNIYFEHGVEFGVAREDVVVHESKTHKERTKSATDAEEMDSKLSVGAKRFKKMHTDNVEVDDTLEKAKKDVQKAGKALPSQSPTRGGEKRIGDKAPINKQKDITK